MSIWIIPPITGLIEPAIAPEFYIDNVGAIELIGACVRIYYYAEQMPLERIGNECQKVVVAKIIRPFNTIPQAIGRLAQCLECERAAPVIPGTPSKPHIVR